MWIQHLWHLHRGYIRQPSWMTQGREKKNVIEIEAPKDRSFCRLPDALQQSIWKRGILLYKATLTTQEYSMNVNDPLSSLCQSIINIMQKCTCFSLFRGASLFYAPKFRSKFPVHLIAFVHLNIFWLSAIISLVQYHNGDSRRKKLPKRVCHLPTVKCWEQVRGGQRTYHLCLFFLKRKAEAINIIQSLLAVQSQILPLF